MILVRSSLPHAAGGSGWHSIRMTEIRRMKDLSEGDRQKLFGWGENLFGVLPFKLTWRTKDWHVVAYAEGSPVAHAGVLRHDVLVDGRPVPVGGLGGVITVLEYRNRGLAQLVVHEAVAFMTCLAVLVWTSTPVPLGR